ncbi:hypothetical protein PR202_gb03048 [Eleusine coracana subsp. coracana]|uniref:Histone deacetylase n=1 Tax=Eleusine coracana subsp. coracana TaxID=191504 RepID=A0AAV5E0T0_ELECO|nr:hypothetical protein PR202_gb03048 [Eleusine coracana subsp. coracana]
MSQERPCSPLEFHHNRGLSSSALNDGLTENHVVDVGALRTAMTGKGSTAKIFAELNSEGFALAVVNDEFSDDGFKETENSNRSEEEISGEDDDGGVGDVGDGEESDDNENEDVGRQIRGTDDQDVSEGDDDEIMWSVTTDLIEYRGQTRLRGTRSGASKKDVCGVSRFDYRNVARGGNIFTVNFIIFMMVKFTGEQARRVMARSSNVRNICIINRHDCGNSTLKYSLVEADGSVAREEAGDARVTDIEEDELRCGSISVYYVVPHDLPSQFEKNGNEDLINLIDAPSQADLSSDIAGSMHITDGALVVVDCIEGLDVQADVDGEEAYHMISQTLDNVNFIMGSNTDNLFGDIHVSPEKGTVAFSAGLHGWAFTLGTFAKVYASEFRIDETKMMELLWGDNFYDSSTEKWFTKPTGAPTSSNHLLEMVILHLPSPLAAQKYRLENLYGGPIDDIYATALRNCDQNGPLMLYVSKIIPASDKGSSFAFGRVFSGKLSTGMKVRMMDPNCLPGQKEGIILQAPVICLGKTQQSVEEVPCGNMVYMFGLDQSVTENATLTNEEVDAYPIRDMKFSVARVALQRRVVSKLNADAKEAFFNDDFEKSVRLFTQAIETGCPTAQLYFDRAQVHFKTGNYCAAVADCNKAITLDDSLNKAYFLKGFSQFKLKNDQEAKKTLGFSFQSPANDTRLSVLSDTCSEPTATGRPIGSVRKSGNWEKSLKLLGLSELACDEAAESSKATSTNNLAGDEAVEASTSQVNQTEKAQTIAGKGQTKVFIIYDYDMCNHRPNTTIDDDSAKRIPAIIEKLEEEDLLRRCDVASKATVVNVNHVHAVHSAPYYDFIKQLPLKGRQFYPYKAFYEEGIVCSGGTSRAVDLAAGAVVEACRLVFIGQYESAFAIVQPPGHHAYSSYACGFCYLNNVAIGAKYLQLEQNVGKILVIDFDVHHGDGTQSIFLDDNRVLFLSIHRDDMYPTKGTTTKGLNDIGVGNGKGYTINASLGYAITNGDMLAVFDYLFLPVAQEFEPDFVLVSAGFDAAIHDIGQSTVDPACYGELVRRIKNISHGKLVLALEGGYKSSLPDSCAACVKALLSENTEIVRTYKDTTPKTWGIIAEPNQGTKEPPRTCVLSSLPPPGPGGPRPSARAPAPHLSRRHFLNASTGQCIQVDVPELGDHGVLGSSTEGLLVLFCKATGAVRLLNPLTRQTAELPPFASLQDDGFRPGYIGRYWSSNVSLLEDGAILLRYFSPGGTGALAVAKPGDKCWALFRNSTSRGLFPAMTFAGRFYGVSDHAVMVLDTSSAPPRLVVAAELTMPLRWMTDTVHLVDNGGELMLVHRMLLGRVYPDNRQHNEFKRNNKRTYKVYRVNLEKGKTMPARGLGGRAVFIGLSRALSVSPQVFPSIDGNTVYPGLALDERGGDEQIGAHHLRDGSAQSFKLRQKNWPRTSLEYSGLSSCLCKWIAETHPVLLCCKKWL